MGLEALQWDNLVRIAEEARDKYVDFSDELPGKQNCGEAKEFIAERLYAQLGENHFDELVSCAFFQVPDGRGHYLIVIGEKNPNFRETFERGVKMDPTVYQFRNIHPELDRLNGQSVFNGDYPKIYNPSSLIEDPYFEVTVKEIKRRAKGDEF